MSSLSGLTFGVSRRRSVQNHTRRLSCLLWHHRCLMDLRLSPGNLALACQRRRFSEPRPGITPFRACPTAASLPSLQVWVVQRWSSAWRWCRDGWSACAREERSRSRKVLAQTGTAVGRPDPDRPPQAPGFSVSSRGGWLSGQTSQKIPKGIPKKIPERMPQRMPERMEHST